ncbi:protein of unknown function DUF1330 [Methylobacterium sp. 4-46]|uniref:DUF1330 domain-containing protein n=1 Tax=unclassified Methylobacterium TaxID=2615210 RepID=UPI000152BFA7|nr:MULTISPECIES: DUF1330 domain-containing protein [Methylobacterium]ACA17069.1 protein of unknown function DUF1330 [Methylobacterium sp. 4-46]WFT82755.1 DUF1330 domain-containing protein [Methylobacterium nodulans]
MPRGYWIARVDVHDEDAYKNYVAANGAAFAKFGGRFLVRGGAFEAVSGTSRKRNVVLEFPSYADALACWNSPEYQEARAKQQGGAEIDLVVIEGYDGPQPTLSAPPQPDNPASE